MAFNRKRPLIIVSILVLVWVVLRVYGAYQRERDDALEQAGIGEQRAQELSEESEKLQQRSDCNHLWQQYEIRKLDKRIAELRGTRAPTPVEPPCTGYAVRMDESLEMISRQMSVSMAVLDAREYAKCERIYASSRNYQTRYLFIRFWGFLTGAEPKMKPVEMVRKIERAAMLDGCIKQAKDDSQRKVCESALRDRS